MGTETIEKTVYRDCEDAGANIPRKKFRSHFTWELYEVTRSYEPFAMVGWFSGLLFFLRYTLSSSHYFWTGVTVVVLVISIIFTPLICMIYRSKRAGYLVSRNDMALSEATKEVFSSEQETLALGWDKVASKLNRNFYTTGYWKTPYCIFDGAQCEQYFRRYVLKAIHEKKSPESSENSCLHAAASTYQQKIIDQFNWDKEDNLVLIEDKLPAESHRCKSTWRLKKSMRYTAPRVCFFIMFVFICLARTWPSRLARIAEVLYMAVLYCKGHSVKLLKTRNRIRLLATIAQVAPGKDMDRWDVVAKRMNAYLNHHDNIPSYEMFFDGKDCLTFFEKGLEPLISKKINEDRVATYELVPLISEAVGGPSV